MGKLSMMFNTKAFLTHIKNREEMEAIIIYLQDRENINVNICDDITEESALMLSIQSGFKDLTRLLLADSRVNQEYQNSDGEAAMTYAASHGDIESMYCLINNGVNPYVSNNDRSNILHLSVMSNHVNVLQLVKYLNIPINWNAQDVYGQTPFYISVGNSGTSCMEFLVSIPEIDFNIPNWQGRTPAEYLQQYEDDDEKLEILFKLGNKFHWP